MNEPKTKEELAQQFADKVEIAAGLTVRLNVVMELVNAAFLAGWEAAEKREATGMKDFWMAEAKRQHELLQRALPWLRGIRDDKDRWDYPINKTSVCHELKQLIAEIEGAEK